MKNMIYIWCVTNTGSMEMYNTPKSQHTSEVITMYVNAKVSSATVVIIFIFHSNTIIPEKISCIVAMKNKYPSTTAQQVVCHRGTYNSINFIINL